MQDRRGGSGIMTVMATPIEAIPGFAEPVSSWTHLLGAALMPVVATIVARRLPRGQARGGVAVFAVTAVFALSMSGVYHLLTPQGAARAVLQRLDHAGIFALIAGTFTAVHLAVFRGVGAWAVPVLLWIVAATAIPLKTVFFTSIPESLSLTIYLACGWLGLLSAWMVGRAAGARLLLPLIYGGLAYSAGAIMEYVRWPEPWPGVIGPHELFHLAVLAGLAFHWIVVARVGNLQEA